MTAIRTLRAIGATAAVSGLVAVAAAPAGAATINPSYWDFGLIALGTQSAPKAFVTTGQVGDSFTAHPRLLGFDPDAFRIVSDGCNGKLFNGPEDTCSVSVAFYPTDDQYTGDMMAILTIPGYGPPQADLNGEVGDDEGGAGKERAKPGNRGRCKSKKFRKKHKKKCKKQKQGR